MVEIKNHAVVLKQRPVGVPKTGDFEVVEMPIPNPDPGQVLVRNRYMSVDPYMRGRMIEAKSYTPSFQIGEILTGGCVGEVVVSERDDIKVGDQVLGFEGWREYFLSDGQGLTKIDTSMVPIQSYLGVMGMPGMTAYVGLLDIGDPKPGETVFVSAASGAVGSIVCQIAKIKGCRVVGSAGSDAKVAWLLTEAGVDAAFNYKETQSLSSSLSQHCPDGIDIYFENVGGAHLEAALGHMNDFGRIPVCGMISQYNLETGEPGPKNMTAIIGKRLKLQGFIVSDHYDRLPQFNADMTNWIGNGQVKWKETIYQGLESAPEALIGLFRGDNFGKMLVSLSSAK
jgi:NADPH-dependent curcumin reductase CurA